VVHIALANLLHRLHETVLEPEFSEADFALLNHAVPRFLQEVGGEAKTGLGAMLVKIHDAVRGEREARKVPAPTGRRCEIGSAVRGPPATLTSFRTDNALEGVSFSMSGRHDRIRRKNRALARPELAERCVSPDARR
jgi:hypothetical protein